MATPEQNQEPIEANSRSYTAHDEPEWQDALSVLQTIPHFARPSAQELSTLARACAEPRQLRLLLEAFARHAATLAIPAADEPDSNKPTATARSKTARLCQLTDTADGLSAPHSGPLPYALLCDFVDDSAHDLREWINALTLFADWLCAHNRQPQPLTMLLPYLACSAEAQANSPMPLPLPHILADMLELYGYDGN